MVSHVLSDCVVVVHSIQSLMMYVTYHLTGLGEFIIQDVRMDKISTEVLYNFNMTVTYIANTILKCNDILALYFAIYDLAKLCANAAAFSIYCCSLKKLAVCVTAETCWSVSVLMDRCILLVVNLFLCIVCMEDVQY